MQRRIVPWLVAYLAGAWVVLEASAFTVDNFDAPGSLPRVLSVALAFGALSTLVLAWFHGRAGWQRVSRREVVLHLGIGLALVGTLAGGEGPRLAEAGTDPSRPPPLERIAVLYFKDHSPARDHSGLVQDLTESVVHELAVLAPLQVLPLAAVAPYREEVSLSRIVEDLRVGTLVEGSLSVVGDSLRVVAQLVDARPGTHLGSWAWTFPLRRSPNIARELAVLMTDRIRVALGQEIRAREQQHGTASPDALERYRLAQEVYQQEAAADWKDSRADGLALLAEADSLLVQASRLDPSWPAPHLLRSQIAEDRSLLVAEAGQRSRPELLAAIGHVEQAFRAGGESAAALERRGTLRFLLAEYAPAEQAPALLAAAEADLRAAHRLDEQRAGALITLSDVLARQGKYNAASTYAHRAVAADAFLELGSDVLYRIVEAELQLERIKGAMALCSLAERRFPNDQGHFMNRILILASRRAPDPADVDRAWEAAGKIVELGLSERRPDWEASSAMMVAGVLARASMADSAEAVMRRSRRRLVELHSPNQYGASYFEAYARLQLGQRDSSLALLRHYAGWHGGRVPSLSSDWWFRELWDDPEFQAITGTTPLPGPG